ncbi:hypothetical protein SRHO_G00048260 [Serrasalmus rhombeus]
MTWWSEEAMKVNSPALRDYDYAALIMICLWWIIFKALAVMAEAGTSSGSSEAAAAATANGGAANPGGAGGVILPQLVLVQQAPAPIGQNGLPPAQGLPIAFPVLQQQGGNPQPQGQAPQPIIPLFAVLPQATGAANGQLANSPQLQLIPVAGLNLQQGGAAAGKARVKHSISNWLLRPAGDITTVTQGPATPVSTATTIKKHGL